MWDKIKRKAKGLIVIIYIIAGICLLAYIPIKCGIDIYADIKNPPSKIYAENQKFDYWDKICIISDSEGACELYGYELITKSTITTSDGELINIVTEIGVDEFYEEFSVVLRDWDTGEIIQPYPQEDTKWYEFGKNFDTFSTFGTLFSSQENGEELKNKYEITLHKNKILITKNSCDSKGLEENNEIKGGCFFLEFYEENRNQLHRLDIELKENRRITINI